MKNAEKKPAWIKVEDGFIERGKIESVHPKTRSVKTVSGRHYMVSRPQFNRILKELGFEL